MNDILYWVWLAEAIGPCSPSLIPLLREFTYIEDIYENRNSTIMGMNLRAVEYKRMRLTELSRAHEIIEQAGELGVDIICYSDETYPARLRATHFPPTVLYVTGNVKSLNADCVAGVGARGSTRYGREAAQKLCMGLAKSGLTLVSGLAHGIDSEVHRAALANNAPTIAVLGTAIDDTYPRDHIKLRRDIESAGGAVVSEYPPGTRWNRGMFPMRNRIISGLSRAVIVFEAAKKSGTMITANWALDDGREVFAVPGSIFAETSEGTNRLIKQGAYPATCAADVLSVLGIDEPDEEKQHEEQQELTRNGKKILAAVKDAELTLDDLAQKTGISPMDLLAELTELEMDGVLTVLPGPKYTSAL